jgi:sporulation protein YlmC with PRC-barrel domain
VTGSKRARYWEATTVTEHQESAEWNVAEWHGKLLVDRDGAKIGKLQDVYVDVENDEPQFATIKEGFIGRHLTFVPLGGIKIGPDELQVTVTREQIKSAPNIEQHGEELSRQTNLPSTTTTSSTTLHPIPRADAASPAADAPITAVEASCSAPPRA